MSKNACELVPAGVRRLVRRLRRREASYFRRSARLYPLLGRLSVDDMAAVLEAAGLLDDAYCPTHRESDEWTPDYAGIGLARG